MPSVVAVETRPPRSSPRAALAAGGAVVVAALIWLVLSITGTPATVPRVTVVNNGDVAVDVAVAPAPGAGVVDLGPVDPHGFRTVSDVIDQGDEWVFVVDSSRGPVGSVPVKRDQLVRDRWTVQLAANLTSRRDGAAP